MVAKLGECSQNMFSEAFWTPNIASLQFDEYSDYVGEAKVRPIKDQLGSTNSPNYVREANVCPIKNGLY